MTVIDVSQRPVLLVDDEPQLLRSASVLLRSSGVKRVLTLDDSRGVLALLAEQKVGVLVLDLTMPNISGHDLLEHIAVDYPEVPVIIMTATNDLDNAVKCMQIGALDYIVKPAEKNRFVSAVTRALEIRALRDEILSLKERVLTDELHHADAFAEIVTQSKNMRSIFRYAEAIAASQQPVLITGETGTGKELVARAIHELSGRSGQFVAVNVAGLDDNVFSDTLFGHTKGAFTGAQWSRDGLLAEAAEGTLFLDEIGDLKESSQVKLLRLLQDYKYYPLGSDQPRQSNARVVVATNRNIIQRTNDGAFRKDVYYRLRAHHVHVPPLRDRKEDIGLLTDRFLEKAARALNKKRPTPPLELYSLLKAYPFPGNVRELDALIFDAVVRHQKGVLSLRSFKEIIHQEQPRAESASADGATAVELAQLFADGLPTLKEAEHVLISEALRRADGNQGIAAGMLGLTRQALNKRLIRHRQSGIDKS
ncbi:MAG: sigma-54-dependent transcriptional regulator [Acidiferrobacterales bacterium]